MTMVQPTLFEPAAADQPNSLVDELRSFAYRGQRTVEELIDGTPFFVNEFWTARQRQAHALHEVSYRACFKPQLPEFFIERLTMPGDVVYDPFMGRGTTPLQAALMGRNAIGNDINPLSVLLTRPRISPPSIPEIARRLDELDWKAEVDPNDELLTFYHPETLGEIISLKRYLLRRDEEGSLDKVDDWIRMVAINRLTGHSSGFFSVYSLPPNQAVSIASQERINRKRNQTPPRRYVAQIILKKSRALLKDGVPPSISSFAFSTAAAENTPSIEESTVDLVVTSPPFLDIVQYASDNWLRCWFAGIEARSVGISMHRKPEDWQNFVTKTFSELARVVRPGGHVCFEVGEVRNGTVRLDSIVLAAIEDLPFRVLGVLVNEQDFTKTANCWGVTNNSKGTNSNRIVMVQRH
jgi:hypothetical protein